MYRLKQNKIMLFAVSFSLLVHFLFFFMEMPDHSERRHEKVIIVALTAPLPEKTLIKHEEIAPQLDKKQENKQAPIKQTKHSARKEKIVKKPVEQMQSHIVPVIIDEANAGVAQIEEKNVVQKEATAINRAEESLIKQSEESAAKSGVAGERPAFSSEAQYIEANLSAIRQQFMQGLVYPEKARRMGIEGKGAVLLIIAKDGVVKDVSLASELGNSFLNKAALDAAHKIHRVTPPEFAEVNIIIPVTFSLF